MYEWTPEQQMIRDAVRQFVETEIRPRRDELEFGDTPPYDVLRTMYRTFGLDAMAREQFRRRIDRERAAENGPAAKEGVEDGDGASERSGAESSEHGVPSGREAGIPPSSEGDHEHSNERNDDPSRASEASAESSEHGVPSGREAGIPPSSEGDRSALFMLPIIELCRCSPGMVTALGVSVGLTSAAIMGKGTLAQKERWAEDLLTLEKVGAWAITEPNSGSDAFGSMQSSARRDGDEYVLNGSKTFITNGPYADTTVFICKLDEGNPPAERKVLHFVLDRGIPGFEQSKPLRKMGMHSSPTGELFLTDVRVGRDRLLGEREDASGSGREGAKATFTMERTGVAAMALGIVERCLELCLAYAKDRVQFGKPIGEYQLIQLKLAKMEVARVNLQNLVFRQVEMSAAGTGMNLAEASACKLYAAQAAMDVTLEAVQLFGGNGYMAEYEVEQLCRDAKVLQIYGGTDEIQVSQIARTLLA